MNIITVFLYSFINQIIYIKLLHDYRLSDKIILLNKVLYDLNHSIFLKNSIIITVYIDDLLLINSSKSVI